MMTSQVLVFISTLRNRHSVWTALRCCWSVVRFLSQVHPPEMTVAGFSVCFRLCTVVGRLVCRFRLSLTRRGLAGQKARHLPLR